MSKKHKGKILLNVPYARKKIWYGCGPTVLSLVAKYEGVDISAKRFFCLAKTKEKRGTSCANMACSARRHLWTFETLSGSIHLLRELLGVGIAPIVYTFYKDAEDLGYGDLDRGHFEIVTGISKKHIFLHDVDPKREGGKPSRRTRIKKFLKRWRAERNVRGKWILALSNNQKDKRFVPPHKFKIQYH